MGLIEGWIGWLAANPGDAGDWLPGWLGNARTASNVVIAVANLYVARVLYRLYRRGADQLPSPRFVVLFAGLVVLFGVSHLALLLDGRAAAWLVPVALKVLTAVLWVAVAARLPAVAARIATNPSPNPIPQAQALDAGPAAVELALMSQRLRGRARALESMVRNENWLFNKRDALHELRAIIDDLEGVTCKI